MPTYTELTPQRAAFVFYAYVDGTASQATYSTAGLLVGSGQLMLKETAPGVYVIKLPRAFKRILSVQVTPITALSAARVTSTVFTDQFEIGVNQFGPDLTTPVANGKFFAEIVASDSSDEYPFDR